MIIRLPRGISFILFSSAKTNFLISFAKGRIVTQIFLRLFCSLRTSSRRTVARVIPVNKSRSELQPPSVVKQILQTD